MTTNHLLDSLPPVDRERLRPAFTPLPVRVKQVLFDAGEPADALWFPAAGAAVSLIQVFRDGAVVEAGIIGAEGVAGFEPLLGCAERMSRGVVQAAGVVLRGDRRVLESEFRRGGALHDAVLRFSGALFLQVAQTVGCNRLHGVQSRVARWLLWLSERSGSDELAVTQDLLADMLGTRRAGVSEALAALAAGGSVGHSRSRIVILQRDALAGAACECYERHSREYARLLS